MARFLDIVNGIISQIVPISTSTGASDANKMVQTGADGRLSTSLLPTTIAIQVKILPASEALTAGQLVNIWDDTGTLKVRKADAANSRYAVGYVSSGYATDESATVYLEGVNTNVSGLTPGLVWLGNAGAVTQTPPTSGSGGINQIVGTGLSATELEFESNDPWGLASS